MFQRSEITQSMFSNHNAIMLENNDEKIDNLIYLEIKEYISKWNKYISKSKRKQWK